MIKSINSLLWLFIPLLVSAQSGIKISAIKCEGQVDPVGIDTHQPALGWEMVSQEQGAFQTAYQILVSASLSNLNQDIGEMWDSGKVLSDQSNFVSYRGKDLARCKEYFWKVRVWDKNGKLSPWSVPGSWVTGLFSPAEWKARWITMKKYDRDGQLPIFRKEFVPGKKIKKAIALISGLGQYELFLNGEKVGDQFMAPAWSDYEKTIYYNTFDITDLLDQENCFSVMLGNGFCYVPHNAERYVKIHSDFGKVKLIMEVHCQYEDGTSEILITDESWKTTSGPIVFSSIYGGEDFDATLEPEGWNQYGYDDSSWEDAMPIGTPFGRLAAQKSLPVKIMEIFLSEHTEQLDDGSWRYDFPQNASAIPEISIKGKKGSKVILRYGEQLNPDGSVNQKAIGINSLLSYTLKGEGVETWSPQFFYSGYQFIQVTGAVPEGADNPDGLPVLEGIKSKHVRYSGDTSGTFSCSNELFNQIYRINDWSVRSNLQHTTTDCPHREKLGWLEVTHLMAKSIMYRYDVYRLYPKILADIRDAQAPDGFVPTVAPKYNRDQFQWKFTYAPEWGSTSVIGTWYTYQWYGDKKILEENYMAMKTWVDFLERHSDNYLIEGTLGDWCDWTPDRKRHGASLYSSPDFVSSAIQYYNITILGQVANILGHSKDAEKYRQLGTEVRAGIREKFMKEEGYFDRNSQTSNAMALFMGLVNPKEKEKVLQFLIDDIAGRKSDDPNKDHRQTAGDIGYRYLVRALSENNCSDVIFEMTNRKGPGSYGAVIEKGLTTMPETWNISPYSSYNHCMLSHIMEWFSSNLAGINPTSENPGFKEVRIQPEITGSLEWVRSSYHSAYGMIKSDWKRTGNNLALEIEVPVNTTAQVHLPLGEASKVTVNGKEITGNDNIQFVSSREGIKVYRIGSGQYHFNVTKLRDK